MFGRQDYQDEYGVAGRQLPAPLARARPPRKITWLACAVVTLVMAISGAAAASAATGGPAAARHAPRPAGAPQWGEGGEGVGRGRPRAAASGCRAVAAGCEGAPRAR